MSVFSHVVNVMILVLVLPYTCFASIELMHQEEADIIYQRIKGRFPTVASLEAAFCGKLLEIPCNMHMFPTEHFIKSLYRPVFKAEEVMALLMNYHARAHGMVKAHIDQIPADGCIRNMYTCAPIDDHCYGFMEHVRVDHEIKITAIGDIHGAVFSLLRDLRRLVVQGVIDESYKVQPGHKIIFLGDYVDRNFYGIEVASILSLLSLSNDTEDVILLRGNHELIEFTRQFRHINFPTRYTYSWNIFDEFCAKYPTIESVKIDRLLLLWFSALHVAYYVTVASKTYMYCHAGLDRLYNQHNFLETAKRYAFFRGATSFVEQEHTCALNVETFYMTPEAFNNLGIMWTDLNLNQSYAHWDLCDKPIDDHTSYSSLLLWGHSNRGDGIYSVAPLQMKKLMKMSGIHGMIRGHQEGPVVQVWNSVTGILHSVASNREIALIDHHTYCPVITVSGYPSGRNGNMTQEGFIRSSFDEQGNMTIKPYRYDVGSVDRRMNKTSIWHIKNSFSEEDDCLSISIESLPSICSSSAAPVVASQRENCAIGYALRRTSSSLGNNSLHTTTPPPLAMPPLLSSIPSQTTVELAEQSPLPTSTSDFGYRYTLSSSSSEEDITNTVPSETRLFAV